MCIFESTPSVELGAVADSATSILVFGRVHTIRSHGRLTFVDLWRNGERLQVVARGDHRFDVGQWVDVVGPARRTQRGEMSVWMEHMRERGAATQEFETQPQHGRIPPEQRFVLEPALVMRMRQRAALVRSIREFLWTEQFNETSTPMLGRFASGAAARPFTTWARAVEREMFLRVAPESQLIRLMMAGFDSVFEIGACFRNEGVSERHQPQFELLECYRMNDTVVDSMNRLERLLQHSLRCVHPDISSLPWGEHLLNWEYIDRRSLVSLVEQHSGCGSAEECVAWLSQRNLWHNENDPMLAWCMVFEQAVESHLIQPTLVTDWPVCISPLARETGNGWTARFELYAGGMELANGYEQEQNQNTQQQRFFQQAQLHGQEDVMAADDEYLFAMGWGMPPLSGFGLGIDRWAQMALNAAHIRDVLPIPL